MNTSTNFGIIIIQINKSKVKNIELLNFIFTGKEYLARCPTSLGWKGL